MYALSLRRLEHDSLKFPPVALCANAAGFQWRSIMCTGIRQSTRFLHQSSTGRHRYRYRTVCILVCSQLFVSYPHLRWGVLPDPDATPPVTETGLRDLFQEIRTTVGQEAQIVQAVFPNPAFVMQVFLQRVFTQSVCLSIRHCPSFAQKPPDTTTS